MGLADGKLRTLMALYLALWATDIDERREAAANDLAAS